MELTKNTNGEKFVLIIDKNEPERFVLTLSKEELELVGLTLEEFAGRRIYDVALRVRATDLSSALWERQQLLAAAEQYKLDREAEEQEGQNGDKPTPDWAMT